MHVKALATVLTLDGTNPRAVRAHAWPPAVRSLTQNTECLGFRIIASTRRIEQSSAVLFADASERLLQNHALEVDPKHGHRGVLPTAHTYDRGHHGHTG